MTLAEDRQALAALITERLERRCAHLDVSADHDGCYHGLDASTAVDVAYEAGWRPNGAELEAANAEQRDRINRLALDRDVLRRQLGERPA